MKRDQWIWGLLPVMVAALYADLLWSPDDVTLGPSLRIFYVHMASAVMAALAFTITWVCSWAYLATRRTDYDVWAEASAEIGLVFTTMVLLTGIIWGRVAWGIWWTWDPRISATVMLWIGYAVYYGLRQRIGGTLRERARLTAIVAIVAYANVPLDYLSIRWWRSLHPTVFSATGVHVAWPMLVALLVTLMGWTGLLGAWLNVRTRLARAQWALEASRPEIPMP